VTEERRLEAAGVSGPLRFSSIRLLDIRVDRVRLNELLAVVRSTVRQGTRLTVMYVNVHCMNVAGHDREYRALLGNADIVYCDGTGVRLGARIAGLELPARMTGADWIHDLCRLAARERYSLFFLGGPPGVAAEAAALLQQTYPGLRIAGTCPGFRLDSQTARTVSESGADIVLVGMGTPRQERWIAANRDSLDVPVVWAVGALFEFVTGRIPRGPMWMTQHGLEWVYRLWAEPGKLWRRYLIGNPLFLARIVVRYRLQGRGDLQT
jgi:N-acetylglucosaminyldiphosphoundecaprenol N-acetyl-beta-D-mannosaminyltransferase